MFRRGTALILTLTLQMGACGSTSDQAEGTASTYTCKNPTAAVVAYDSGYVSCDGYWSHRSAVVACQTSVPRAGFVCQGNVGTPGCATDADCAGTPNGYCAFGPPGTCGCLSGCRQDADCGAGFVCACNEVMGSCVKATCKSDADCSNGNLCATYDAMPHCGQTVFACQKGEDQCASSSDCPDNQGCTIAGGRRVCQPPDCVQ